MLVKINSDNIKDLSHSGVSSQTIEKIEHAKKEGVKFNTMSDLLKIGLLPSEAEVVKGAVSFAPTEPETDFKSVEIKTEPAQLFEYTLFIKYRNKDTGESIGDIYVLDASGKTKIKYDNKIAEDIFFISIKAPNGEFIATDINGKKALTQEIKKNNLKDVEINITAFNKTETNTSITIGIPSKLKGRLISNNPGRNLENVQIVFFIATSSSEDGNPDFYPVAYAETETGGYFFSSQLNFRTAEDYNNIIKAKAKIVLDGNKEIDIPLEPRVSPIEGTLKGQLPERVILYLEESTKTIVPEKDCDCDCKDLDFYKKKVLDEFSYYTVVRTTEPLIKAHEISDVDEVNIEDILDGIIIDPIIKGNLAGIRTPRILLKTFIQRNGTITKENVNKLVQETQAHTIKTKLNKPSQATAITGRLSLDTTNSVDWDEKPTIYEAVSIAHGHLLNFKQQWLADGYSIGDLLYSLPLAPGQKKQIVVFDWDRKDSASNTQRLDYQESLYNSLSRDRDINEIANAAVNEHMEGESTAHTWGIGGGIAGTFGAGIFGVAGGYGGATSSASQDASRNSTASSQQNVHDRTVQAASSVRSQRATVIQTVSQGERFQVSAEVIANYNHCHAMTVQYFEVLRHFEVSTKLANVKECLFVPLEYSPFDRKKSMRWRDILSARLRKGNLRKGFDAIERIEEELESGTEDYYDKIGFPKKNFAEFELKYLEGELFFEFELRRPKDWEDDIALGNWDVFTPFLGDPKSFYNAYLKDKKDKDEAFARHAGPILSNEIIKHLTFYAINGQSTLKLPLEATLLSDFRNKSKLNVTIRMDGNFVSETKRKNIDFIEIRIEGNDNRLLKIKDMMNEGMDVTIYSGSMRYRTDQSNEYLFRNASIKNDISIGNDNVRIYTPLSRQELRNPRNEDVEACNSLLHHLNENLEYYHQVIWRNMDAQRRFMLLDGIIAPGKANGRSVASVVENRLIGIVGNCLVMPVSAGFQLDPTLDDKIDLFQHYYQDPLDPIRLSLPTKGVFAEAVMGKCNSCEKKDETRFWRWEESPIPDSPTSINPVNTPTPQNVQPNVQVKDFPTPIINLQNAPSIPDPQGYGALAQLIGNPNLFRDVTGLAANQANAMGAMNSSLAAAQNFAGMAKELESQKQNQAHSDSIIDAVKNSGLPQEDQNRLLMDHLQQRIDGGAGKKAEQEAENKKNEPSAMGIAADAASQGKSTKASKTDSSGNNESVEVGPGKIIEENVLAEAKGYYQNLQQTMENDCWAVAATIMMGWKKAKKLSVEEVLTDAGEPYLIKYQQNDTLRASEKDGFIEVMKMAGEAPASYPLQDYITMLQTFGPLWITTDAADSDGDFSPHARILFKITGTDVVNGTDVNFHFKDPAISGDQQETYEDFLKKYEQLVTDGTSGNLTLQIVHFKDLVEEGEGRSTGKTEAELKNDLVALSSAMISYENQIINNVVVGQNWLATAWNSNKGNPGNVIGYVAGMAILYGRAYSRLKANEPYVKSYIKLPFGSTAIDGLKIYETEYYNKTGITTFNDVEVIRYIFSVLFGLGMQESFGDNSDDLNLDFNPDILRAAPGLKKEDWLQVKKTNKKKYNEIISLATRLKPAFNCEAGMLQISNSLLAGNTAKVKLSSIYKIFKDLPGVSNMLEIFKIRSSSKSPNPTPHIADGEQSKPKPFEPEVFQEKIFGNPLLSVELAALGIRIRRTHWGPFDPLDKTITFKKEFYDMLIAIETIMDADPLSKAIGFVRAFWKKIDPLKEFSSILQIQSTESGLWILGSQDGSDYNSIDLLSNGTIDTIDLTGEEDFSPSKIYIDQDDVVWVIDTENRIWNNKEGGYFKIFSTELAKDIAIDSNGVVWIIALTNDDAEGSDIKKCVDQNYSSNWETIIGKKGDKIFIDRMNVTWVINKAGELSYSFGEPADNNWKDIYLPDHMDYLSGNVENEKATDIAFDLENNLWIIGNIATVRNNFSVYRQIADNSISEWVSYDGAGIAIEIDKADGLPIVLNDNGKMYKLNN